jgi:hypothetical protein
VLPEESSRDISDCVLPVPKRVTNVRAQAELGWTPGVPVPEEHYWAQHDWDTCVRFRWQIRNVMEAGLRKVLEIGVGSGMVTYLRRNGIRAATLDIASALHPDRVVSLTAIPFLSARFEGLLCTILFEHIPIELFCEAVAEISRVARFWDMVAEPPSLLSLTLLLRAPILHLREIRVRIAYPGRSRPAGIRQNFGAVGSMASRSLDGAAPSGKLNFTSCQIKDPSLPIRPVSFSWKGRNLAHPMISLQPHRNPKRETGIVK